MEEYWLWNYAASAVCKNLGSESKVENSFLTERHSISNEMKTNKNYYKILDQASLQQSKSNFCR